MRTRGFLVVVALAGAVMWPSGMATAGNLCHKGATEGSGDTVTMSEMCFTPTVLRVEPGALVTFVNKDPIPHNISAEWGRGAELLAGDTFKAVFDDEGTFPYACTYHYQMVGAVVVGNGGGPGTGMLEGSGSAVDATPVSQARAGSDQTNGSGILGWTIAGAIGLLLGAGLTGLLRRGRQED